ncbi:MAG TPA: leucine-rich repeat domain-containing protein, partial [Clostridia bacterium]|nr:leucine-rich repeat domain-containing protein [Clostridia bacterium]
ATNGFPVTNIGEGAFLRCSSLTNVLLPDTIVTIGDSAFASCFGLATISFPANLATIGDRAFDGCKLTTVAIPQSVTNIGYCAFTGCNHLEQFTVEGLNPYYCDLDGVLFNRSRTTLIQCPARKSGSYLVTNIVTSIGDFAFSGSALRNIDISTGVMNVGRGAFNNATALTNISIPDTITNLGNTAFYGCSGLLSMSIPDRVTSIGRYTFFKCSSLTNFSLGRSVTDIGESAFYGCSNLTHLAIPDSVTNLDIQAFIHCSGLRSVWVGKRVANVGDAAFLGCVDLAEVYFTGDAPSVGPSVFGYSSVIVYYLPQTTGWGPTLGGWPTKLWNPTVQTGAPQFGIHDSCFGFTITGTPDIPIAVAACTDPAKPIWTPLQTCTLTNGSIYFSDPDWTNYPTRFYRIQSP